MKELERRALMGDKEAQRKCTEQGVVLPCPWCKCEVSDLKSTQAIKWFWRKCRFCGAESPAQETEFKANWYWNTRPAPPVGRCKDCKYFGESITKDPKNNEFFCNHDQYGLFALDSPDAYCSYFEPEDTEKDEKWKANIDAML